MKDISGWEEGGATNLIIPPFRVDVIQLPLERIPFSLQELKPIRELAKLVLDDRKQVEPDARSFVIATILTHLHSQHRPDNIHPISVDSRARSRR